MSQSEYSVEENILNHITLVNDFGFKDIPGFWQIYGYGITIALLSIAIILTFYFLTKNSKPISRFIQTTAIIFFAVPLSYFVVESFYERKPTSIDEILYFKPQYNLEFSHFVVLKNHSAYFLPSYIGELDKSIKFNIEDVKRVYFSNSIHQNLDGSIFKECSIYLFTEVGKGDLSNNQYLSISFNTDSLKDSCESTAKTIANAINTEFEKYEETKHKLINVVQTDSSIFMHEYPKAPDEFNIGIVVETDEHDHSHDHDHEYNHENNYNSENEDNNE